MMAKKGNPRSSGYARVKNDFYIESPQAVHALLDAEKFAGNIYDPCCGSGNIIKVARSRGLSAYGSDIEPRHPKTDTLDFLSCYSVGGLNIPMRIDNVICNPPFKLAEKFLDRALDLRPQKIAMFLRTLALEGERRWAKWEHTPLARIYIFPWRVSVIPGEGLSDEEIASMSAQGGFMAFSWFVWRFDHEGPPTVHLLKKPKPPHGNG